MLNASPHAIDRAPARTGFTLVELLVTMVIGALLIAFLFQLFNATVKAWHAGEDQNDTFREARAALQMMERDISQISAALPNNAYPSPTPTPSPSLTPTPTPPAGVMPMLVIDHYPLASPSPVPNAVDAKLNQEIYCLTNIPNNGLSSLCAVGYFCIWIPDLPNSNARSPYAYALIRQYLGSGSPTAPGLFDRLKVAASPSPMPFPLPPLTFINLYERSAPPLPPTSTPSPPTAVATELCSYVWDLQFRTPTTLQDALPTPTPVYVVWPSPSPSTTGRYPIVLPPYVEIRFKALSAGAARKLEGNTAVTRAVWSDPTNAIYKTLIQPGTRQFVARVPLYGGSSTSTP